MNNIENWRIRKARLSLIIHKNGNGYLFGDRRISEEQFDPKFLEEIKAREIKIEVNVKEDLLVAV